MKLMTNNHVRSFRSYQLKNIAELLIGTRPASRLDAKQKIIEYAAIGEEHNTRAWEAVTSAGLAVATTSTTGVGGGISEDKLVAAVAAKLAEGRDAMFNGAIAELKKEVLKYRPIEVVLPNEKPAKLKGRQHQCFERVIQLASQRVNVLLVGPAGSGKTFLGSQIAKALKMDFSSISCSAGMSESQLSGWLLPTGKAGQFEYSPSPFVNMYEKGGVFLLDEIDSADPNTMTFMNKALANSEFFVPQRLSNPRVAKHKNFAALAAANTYGNGTDVMYVGRNQLDAATMDRFRAGTVIMDYDTSLEQELVEPSVLEWGWRIREGIRTHGLRRIMSTRVMLDLSKMTKAYGWMKEQWEISYFADWSSEERQHVLR